MLAVYQEKNDIVPPGTRKNVRRKRTKSMFVNRAKDDMYELHTKFNSPNFGLKSSRDRRLNPEPQQPLSEWQKMSNEFKKKVELKLAKK